MSETSSDRVRVCEEAILGYLDGGDPGAAVTEAVRSYGPELVGYLTGILRDPELAEEAFGDLCEDLWKTIGSFRRECSMRTWTYRLAFGRIRRVRGSAHARRVRRFESAELSDLVESMCSMTSILHTQACAGALARLRAALDVEEQTLLTLRLDRELSWSDVASVLASDDHEIDEATVRKRFERVKDKLRAMAQDEGLFDA